MESFRKSSTTDQTVSNSGLPDLYQPFHLPGWYIDEESKFLVWNPEEQDEQLILKLFAIARKNPQFDRLMEMATVYSTSKNIHRLSSCIQEVLFMLFPEQLEDVNYSKPWIGDVSDEITDSCKRLELKLNDNLK